MRRRNKAAGRLSVRPVRVFPAANGLYFTKAIGRPNATTDIAIHTGSDG